MPDLTARLAQIADRIDRDEDFAMRIGEDARTTLEAEGLPDDVIAAVLAKAESDVVGFALPADQAQAQVRRVADAARQVGAP